MKYLAKICTSALTFGLLAIGGTAAASAHQVNANQNQNNYQQNTQVTNNNIHTYPLYHFHNDQNGLATNHHAYHHVNNSHNSVILPSRVAKRHLHHHAAGRNAVKLAAVNNVNGHSAYSEDNKANQKDSQNSAKTYYYRGNLYNNKDSYRAARFSNSRIGKLASTKLGDPYMWGATGANAFDCSGFTQYLYRNAKHINIPRTAQAQYDYEKHVSYNHIKPGDLVFFGYSPRAIAHVGMYIGNGKMIDAQNRGVITEYVKAPWWNLVGCARVRRNLDLD